MRVPELSRLLLAGLNNSVFSMLMILQEVWNHRLPSFRSRSELGILCFNAFWTPACAGVTLRWAFYESINF